MMIKIKRRNDLDDEDFDEGFSGFGKKVIVRQIVGKEYTYYLTGPVVSFEQYNELFALLRYATQQDTVKLYIDSGGGSVAVAEAIIVAIQQAQEAGANVVGQIGTDCASAASIIALSCNNIEVFDHSTMLCHPWQSGEAGHAPDLHNAAAFNLKQSEKYIRRHYTGFLTEDEIEEMLTYSKDILLDADEIVKRFQNMLSYYGQPQDQIDPREQLNAIIDERIQEYLEPVKPTTKKKKTTKE